MLTGERVENMSDKKIIRYILIGLLMFMIVVIVLLKTTIHL